MLADSFDSYCFGEVSGEDFEGDVTGSTHGSDNRPVAGWQCRVHPFHGGIFRGNVGRYLGERPALNVDDERRDRRSVLDPVLR